jgi:hypothetical protein
VPFVPKKKNLGFAKQIAKVQGGEEVLSLLGEAQARRQRLDVASVSTAIHRLGKFRMDSPKVHLSQYHTAPGQQHTAFTYAGAARCARAGVAQGGGTR